MARTPGEPTATELEVLKALWALGPATIRQLTDRLYPGGGAAQYATIQKLLERLEDKSCVRRSRRERVNVYAASVDRSKMIAQRLRDTARALCAGSMTPLLTQLVEDSDLGPEELRSLRALVESRARRRGR